MIIKEWQKRFLAKMSYTSGEEDALKILTGFLMVPPEESESVLEAIRAEFPFESVASKYFVLVGISVAIHKLSPSDLYVSYEDVRYFREGEIIEGIIYSCTVDGFKIRFADGSTVFNFPKIYLEPIKEQEGETI